MKAFLAKIMDEKFWKFMLVGGVNTLVGMAIMFGLYNLAGLGYWVSSAANYILTSILSFFLNKYFTFGNRTNSWVQVGKFAVNIAVCYVAAYAVAKPLVRVLFASLDASLRDNLAMAAGMCLFTALNYLGQRFFAFKESGEK